ncbi:MAG: lycopene cyclase family protein [Agriterribacter sp.]
MKEYDYIIIGAGCAGLSLLMRIIDADTKGEKKILLLDKAEKNVNDRTWCFWEKDKGYFEDIIYRTWTDLQFSTQNFSKQLDTGGYSYKMIRGIDFYTYCFDRIKRYKNIEIKYTDVVSARLDENIYAIETPNETIQVKAAFVFNSIADNAVNKNAWLLKQHFKGWTIETDHNAFNKNKALFMDFSIEQKSYEAAFVYMLPLSEQKALIEYTIFSKEILAQEIYETALNDYISNSLKIESYRVTDTEFGVIPMTNHSFDFYRRGIYYIGTAGGQTKASTGYTFRFIQKQSDMIVEHLKKGDNQIHTKANSRFHLYDSILLRVLCTHQLSGKEIFTRLFNAIPAYRIFKFLDNETSFAEELSILNSMPVKIFLPAAVKQMMR